MRLLTSYSCVLLCMLVGATMAQFPFGFMGDFFQNMNHMMGNLRSMGQDIQDQNMRYAQRASAYTQNLRPGERRTFSENGGRGYAYRSPDGGYSSYSYSSGGPNSHGYMFHHGPEGTWERRW